MRILGIDLGTRTGFALWHDGTILSAGTWDLSSRRFEGGGMRFLRFERLLAEAAAGVDLIAFEEVRRHLGTDAAHVYGGLLAILCKHGEAAGVPYTGIPVGSVKRHATGKGNADKTAMLAAANTRWNLALGPKDENEADARWIVETAAALEGSRPQKQVSDAA